MINTLYLPEIREMLAENDDSGLREFCTALNPARTAEFMEGLTADESWKVLHFAEPVLKEEIFSYFPHERQVEILQEQDRKEVALLISDLAADDRVHILRDVNEDVVEELLPLLPITIRRELLRLRAYPEGTAGAMMTTEIAKLGEGLSAREALEELGRQAENLETIYYLYVVDDDDHLKGVVSARQLVTAIGKPDQRLGALMEPDVFAVSAMEDQEEVARKVAHYNLLAIPVVDGQRRLVGIITHDDVIDVVREEATEDAQRIAAVAPLEMGYLQTGVVTLSWKRGVWLTILFFTALFTASALKHYETKLETWPWLMIFIPLIMSCGGNSGNQSATLVITAMSTGNVRVSDWYRIALRELLTGLLLGGFLALFGFVVVWLINDTAAAEQRWWPLVVPLTLVLVVTSGAFFGSMLPLLFKRLGFDPALMSNPFVAGLSDILAIVIYMTVALTFLTAAK